MLFFLSVLLVLVCSCLMSVLFFFLRLSVLEFSLIMLLIDVF